MPAMTAQNRNSGAMHLVTQRRPGVRREYVTHLLRRSYREGGKVKKETIANLTHVPERVLEGLRSLLAGKELVDVDYLVVERSTPHGHVEALLAMMRRLKITPLFDKEPSVQRDLVLAMIAQRILTPGSKLFTTRVLQQSTLAEELNIGSPDTDDLYGAMDWLVERQTTIEQRLAKRHLQSDAMALYDLSSCILKAENVRWRCRGTREMTFAGRYKLSTDCSAIVMDGPW
jgi:hypothetical protein